MKVCRGRGLVECILEVQHSRSPRVLSAESRTSFVCMPNPCRGERGACLCIAVLDRADPLAEVDHALEPVTGLATRARGLPRKAVLAPRRTALRLARLPHRAHALQLVGDAMSRLLVVLSRTVVWHNLAPRLGALLVGETLHLQELVLWFGEGKEGRKRTVRFPQSTNELRAPIVGRALLSCSRAFKKQNFAKRGFINVSLHMTY